MVSVYDARTTSQFVSVGVHTRLHSRIGSSELDLHTASARWPSNWSRSRSMPSICSCGMANFSSSHHGTLMAVRIFYTRNFKQGGHLLMYRIKLSELGGRTIGYLSRYRLGSLPVTLEIDTSYTLTDLSTNGQEQKRVVLPSWGYTIFYKSRSEQQEALSIFGTQKTLIQCLFLLKPFYIGDVDDRPQDPVHKQVAALCRMLKQYRYR